MESLSTKISPGRHTSNICKSFSAKIKNLYNMRSMSKSTLKTIYFQGILPSAIYGIVIWGSSNHLSDVNKIHTKAARFIMKIKKNIPDDQGASHLYYWKPIGFFDKRSVACKSIQNLQRQISTNARTPCLKKSDPGNEKPLQSRCSKI